MKIALYEYQNKDENVAFVTNNLQFCYLSYLVLYILNDNDKVTENEQIACPGM